MSTEVIAVVGGTGNLGAAIAWRLARGKPAHLPKRAGERPILANPKLAPRASMDSPTSSGSLVPMRPSQLLARSLPRSGEVPLYDPPNPLRAKALGEWDEDTARQEVDAAIAGIEVRLHDAMPGSAAAGIATHSNRNAKM